MNKSDPVAVHPHQSTPICPRYHQIRIYEWGSAGNRWSLTQEQAIAERL
ncbi:MAG: hypothetical protein KME22_28300 [Hassallia sp. WJT32-NPBG1]|nr:hypothetical protein [Hassallia sp. WJT32-NPBG1]